MNGFGVRNAAILVGDLNSHDNLQVLDPRSMIKLHASLVGMNGREISLRLGRIEPPELPQQKQGPEGSCEHFARA